MTKNRFEDAVIYQLQPRTFTPQGTLKAAEKLLGHIKSLGFDIVYLTPVTVADDDGDERFLSKRQLKSESGNTKNPYRTKDYLNVDPEYGANGDMKSFVVTAHSLGLRVICDMVFLHCGPTAVFLKDHPDFVLRDENGEVLPGKWRFPQFDFSNPAVREYLIGVMEKWVFEFGADGLRCDVGFMIPVDFWRDAAKRLKKKRPGLLMIDEGEVPENVIGVDPQGVFDVDYSFAFTRVLLKTMKGEMSAAELRAAWESDLEAYSGVTGKKLRYIENHDVATDVYGDRFDLVWDKGRVEMALALCYTMDGVPLIYNGCEVASTCRANMFVSRETPGVNAIEWSNALLDAGKRRMRFICGLNALRHSHTALYRGSLRFIGGTEDGLFAFERKCGSDRVIYAANLSPKPLEVEADLKGLSKVFSSGARKAENGIRLASGGWTVMASGRS